ncbi:transposase (plasmid) [Bradyrhizobium diazoefficiens]|uniref:Transposase n=1 Tax=Bradyrhizobium diazoefficiens TaxID=1355477 RepID=A0A0E4FZB7_9BRAD|nr:transposase [Bradyrhizobium diazoefficiens]
MSASVGRAGMAGDPLALVEDLDRPIVDTGIDQLANQTIRRGVPMAVDLDMIIGSEAAALPACEGIRLIWQRG